MIPSNPTMAKKFVQRFYFVIAGYMIVIYFKTSTEDKMTYLHYILNYFKWYMKQTR